MSELTDIEKQQLKLEFRMDEFEKFRNSQMLKNDTFEAFINNSNITNEKINSRFDKMETSINNGFESMSDKLNSFMKEMQNSLSQVDEYKKEIEELKNYIHEQECEPIKDHKKLMFSLKEKIFVTVGIAAAIALITLIIQNIKL